jgi:luciferase family oxidoreductase group 1
MCSFAIVATGMLDPLVLSVLDQSPVPEGSTGGDALRNTLDLARLADELGYHRYWLAEHHNGPLLAGPSPEVLIGPVAMATSRLRVGSGGVMLPHYSPLKVAESFSVLAGLFGDRIDLAIGRAPGTDPLTTYALQRDRRQAAPDDFPDQLAELLALLEDRIPPDHPFARLSKLPGHPEAPEPWLLGSSPQSAIWAAELGLPYAFADFISPRGAPIAADYRERFQDSHRLAAPHLAVAVWAICAETDEEAHRLAASGRMTMTLLRRGRLIPVPPPDKALRFLQSEGLAVDTAQQGRRTIVGSPDTVQAGIREVVADYRAQEAIVVSITYDHEARRRSYELIAEAFGLTPAPDAPARERSRPRVSSPSA